MKRILFICIAIINIVTVSCKKDDTSNNNNNPVSTYKYYVIADINSTSYKAENNSLQECWSSPYGFCTAMYNGTSFTPLGDVYFFSTQNKPQAAFIQAMKGKTYPYTIYNVNTEGLVFAFKIDGVNYSTINVPVGSRTGNVTVSDVIADGETTEFDDLDDEGNPRYDKCFKLIGTFNGKIAKSDSSDIRQITNGKFAIRFNETKRN